MQKRRPGLGRGDRHIEIYRNGGSTDGRLGEKGERTMRILKK